MQTRFSSNSFGVLRKTGVTALLFATLLQVPLTAQAWQVTVENNLTTDGSINYVAVRLYYGHFGLLYLDKEISPGSKHTFETGSWCPNGLAGQIRQEMPGYGVLEWASMQGTDMYGTWYGNPRDGGAACWNHKMEICAMPQGSSRPYSFCKK